jgi:hypothetical protein
MNGIPDAPREVTAIMRTAAGHLQLRYTAVRRVYRGSGRDQHKALLHALELGMSRKDFFAVERFLKGRDSEAASEHGRLIHDRLLAALEAQDAQALAAATLPWGRPSR